ncbi:TPA: hypothetical protein ACH3X2_010218 [Trebouxia sp. C0005]
MVTAIRAVTYDASFHLPSGSDAQSDSSRADPAVDNTAADSSFMPTTATATMAAPIRSGRQHEPATVCWDKPSTGKGLQRGVLK